MLAGLAVSYDIGLSVNLLEELCCTNVTPSRFKLCLVRPYNLHKEDIISFVAFILKLLLALIIKIARLENTALMGKDFSFPFVSKI